MKLRYVLVLGVVAALTAACGSSSESTGGSGAVASPSADASGTLKVWLMDGSQPQTVVDAVNAEFKTAYPKVTVSVELQKWDGIQDKLTTSLGSATTPDVVEIGNTLTAKFADAGLLADLTGNAAGLGEASWLPGLKASGELEGKRYGIPYYGGTRAVVYNKEQFTKAGVTVPTSLDELAQVAAKLKAANSATPGYSAFYFPGKYWYGALPFVWAHGGDIAAKDGDAWKGTLDSAESQAGLTALKTLVDQYSSAPKDGDETKNSEIFKTGKVGMVIDSWWAPGVIAKEAGWADKVGAFALPGVKAGTTAPAFFGGSDLGVSEKSANRALAVEWAKILTSEKIQTQLAKEGGVIPNTKAAFSGHAGNALLEPFDTAAENSKFTPVTPTWGNVESSSVLQDMLVKIMTGKATVAEATKEASAAITTKLAG